MLVTIFVDLLVLVPSLVDLLVVLVLVWWIYLCVLIKTEDFNTRMQFALVDCGIDKFL